MAKWFVMAKGADFQRSENSFTSALWWRGSSGTGCYRGEQIRKYLYGTIEELYDPKLLKGMEEAVRLLKERIEAAIGFESSGIMTWMGFVPRLF